jgi:hypothetical protein
MAVNPTYAGAPITSQALDIGGTAFTGTSLGAAFTANSLHLIFDAGAQGAVCNFLRFKPLANTVAGLIKLWLVKNQPSNAAGFDANSTQMANDIPIGAFTASNTVPSPLLPAPLNLNLAANDRIYATFTVAQAGLLDATGFGLSL